jgi:hypothetical protein
MIQDPVIRPHVSRDPPTIVTRGSDDNVDVHWPRSGTFESQKGKTIIKGANLSSGECIESDQYLQSNARRGVRVFGRFKCPFPRFLLNQLP